ncbi:hypothetical protein BH10PAT4_BH10PAT4_0530 [soil metagenome]
MTLENPTGQPSNHLPDIMKSDPYQFPDGADPDYAGKYTSPIAEMFDDTPERAEELQGRNVLIKNMAERATKNFQKAIKATIK